MYLGFLETLKYRDFRWVWLGLLISNLGTWAQLYAEQWYVYNLHHSSLQVGLLVSVQALPNIVFYLIGGLFADRFDRKKLLFFTQGTMAFLTLVLAVLVSMDAAPLPIYLAINFMYGLLIGLDIPARKSIVPNLVPKEVLPKALALYNATFQTALFVGPVLGSSLVTFLGFKFAYFFNAMTFAVILLAVYKMKIPKTIQTVEFRPTLLRDLYQAFEVIKQDGVLQTFLVVGGLFYICTRMDYLFPSIASNLLHLGVEKANWLNSSLGVGQIVGSVLVGWFDRPLKQRLVAFFFLQAAWLFGSAMLISGSHSLLIVCAILLLRGLMASVIGILLSTVVQTRTPNESLGRVMGVQTAMLACADLISFPMGLMVDHSGIQSALWVLSLGGIFTMVYLGVRIRFLLDRNRGVSL
ncbi:MAG: MFS transporter [Tumebacillaceae bacterium]